MKSIAATLLSLSLASAATADIQIDFVYDTTTNSVTATYYGSWSVDSTLFIDMPGSPGIGPNAFYSLGSSYSVYQTTPGAVFDEAPWPVLSGVHSGDSFGFDSSTAYGPSSGFSNGSIISGSLYFADTTLLDLNMVPGLSDGFSSEPGTVNWTASQVPEPSSVALILGSLAGAALLYRRRQRA